MFAKLKKKIQEESGIAGPEVGDKQSIAGDGTSGAKISNQSYIHHNADYQPKRRTSSSSLDLEQASKEKELLNEKPAFAGSGESFGTTSKEELLELLMRRTHQVKMFEAKLAELTSLVKEKNQHIEKLEAELEKQQDLLCQRLQDLNEQYHSSRAKLSENITSAVKKREEELRLELQDLEKAKLRLEERVTVIEMEKEHCIRKAEEREAVERAANEERTKLKSLLLQTQADVEQYKKILSEKSSDQIEKKDLLDQISLLAQQKNEAEGRNGAAEDVIASLQARNDRLERLLKESKDAYAQMALQNSQDDWLEKQIESERAITTLEEEISNLKAELSLKDRDRNISVMQLNDKAKEILDFKAQVGTLEAELHLQSLKVRDVEQQSEKVNTQLTDALKDKESFRQRSDELSQLCESLRESLSESKSELESFEKQKVQLISELELQLTEHCSRLELAQQQLSELQASREHHVFETEEIARLKEELTDVQASLQDKNKIIKKQEQRLADLKKLLQRELKVLPPSLDQTSMPTNGTNFQNSIDSVLQQYDATDMALSSFNHSSTSAAAMLPITHSFTQNDTRLTKSTSKGSLISGQDLQRAEAVGGGTVGMVIMQRFNPQGVKDGSEAEYDFTRELNFKYLRHVVLKFMLSRETEAIQLIKAVSMLLNFTSEEQKLIRDTLEWKMSWFGSKPQLPMKGQTAKVIPPSL